MSTLKQREKTQIRVNCALDIIDQAQDELRVRFAVAYAIGYIDALHDEQMISIDGAELYRQDAFERRRVRLEALGIQWDDDQV